MPTPSGREATTKRATVLITVHRRYHELERSVRRPWEAFLLGELPVSPRVWVVWADPEPARVWFLQSLVEQGLVDRVLARRPGPDETGATSVAESRNLRFGLEALQRASPAHASYAVCQAADVLPHYGTFEFVDDRINNRGDSAIVFHWPNGCVQSGVWHTNFFVVPLLPEYWPPLAVPGGHDVLERLWGLALDANRPPGVVKTHNHANRRFSHDHLSEGLPPFRSSPLPLSGSIALACPSRCKSLLGRSIAWLSTSVRSTRKPRRSP